MRPVGVDMLPAVKSLSMIFEYSSYGLAVLLLILFVPIAFLIFVFIYIPLLLLERWKVIKG